jgi:hypothetical protein
MVAPAQATVIDFTGGTVTQWGGTTGVTDGSAIYDGVSYYEEGGFRLTFNGSQSEPFESIVGAYYGAGNDVIHGHWATGDYGGLTSIVVEKIDGTAFDLNYFVLTSNTDEGGSPSSGFEEAYINASQNGTDISYSMLLPDDDWGFQGGNPQILLGSEFDDIFWFSFTVGNAVDCFGMDNFYIDEPAPPVDPVPEPSVLLLLGSGILALGSRMRNKRG